LRTKQLGSWPLETEVFSLQGNLEKASLLEGRPGAIEALLAFSEFLSHISSPADLHHQRHINSLISALMSLDEGGVHPLLRPEKLPGQARSPLANASRKASAAFVANRLVGIGLDRNSALSATSHRWLGLMPIPGRPLPGGSKP
jgi:hypothetical protein